MLRRTLLDRMGKVGKSDFTPLNLIVLSNRMPDAAAQGAMVEAVKTAHDSSAKHPLRMQYSLTRDDELLRNSTEKFPVEFAEANGIDNIVDCATIPDGPAFNDLAVQQLVGKIGTWAIDSVAT